MLRPDKGFHQILEKDHPYIYIDGCVQVWPNADFANAHRHGVTAYCGSFEGIGANYCLEKALDGIMFFHGMARKNPNIIIVDKADDILKAKNEKKAALIISCQEPNWIGNNIHRIEAFYKLGLRMMIPCYSYTNNICGGCLDGKDIGLTKFGEFLVEESNRLGLLLDCAHISKPAALEIIERSSGPVVFSHIAARALVNVPRNIDDDTIKACAKRGGVIGISTFVCLIMKKTERVGVDDFIDHIDYISQLLGSTDNIGIGSDGSLGTYPVRPYNPFGSPKYADEIWRGYRQLVSSDEGSPLMLVDGFDDFGEIITVIEKLSKRGYQDEDISKILGGNFLRVFKQVWK